SSKHKNQRRNYLLVAILLSIGTAHAACCGDTSSSVDDAEGANDDASSDVIELQVGHIAPDDHSYTKGLEAFAERIEEETDGRVTFEMFGNGQLGGEREILEQVQLGSLDMTVATGGVVGSFVPEMSVLEMPFLFDDVDHAYRVLD